ncbi:MAG TPA: hypothetical protein VGV69_03450 [Solirubrobacterales bacterium]|nr:hypothetical protein [Solirubrobacterales bacterium]
MPETETPTVTRASKNTMLRLGEVEAPIGLFKITTDPKQRKWDNPPEVAAGVGDPPAAKGSPLASGGDRSSAPRSSGSAAPPPPPKPKGITKPDGAFVDLTAQIKDIAERTTLDRLEVVSSSTAATSRASGSSAPTTSAPARAQATFPHRSSACSTAA